MEGRSLFGTHHSRWNPTSIKLEPSEFEKIVYVVSFGSWEQGER